MMEAKEVQKEETMVFDIEIKTDGICSCCFTKQ